jgi:hypothetical protein
VIDAAISESTLAMDIGVASLPYNASYGSSSSHLLDELAFPSNDEPDPRPLPFRYRYPRNRRRIVLKFLSRRMAEDDFPDLL